MSRVSKLQYPLVIAHRGLSSLLPENTMPAFMAAVNTNCQMIETDVSLTKDGEVVVIHDETLERTTSGYGRVCDTSFKDISNLDAGLKLSRGKIQTGIPTLKDLLLFAKNRVSLNIELKPEIAGKKWGGKRGEEKIVELVLDMEMGKDVIFSSFSIDILKYLRSLSSQLYLGILTSGEPRPPVKLSMEIDAFSWHPEAVNLNKNHIRSYKEKTGKRVIPYTLNNGKKIKKLVKAGIDGFFTDNPQNISWLHE